MSEFCDACGRGALVERHGTYIHEWPAEVSTTPSEFTESDWLECDFCGEQVLPGCLLRRIEARQLRLEGLLTPDEIKAIRAERSQVEMARFIGVGDKTYSRWENGLSVQTKAMDTLIRAAALHPGLFDEIERSRGQGAKGQTALYENAWTYCNIAPGDFYVPQTVARVVSGTAESFSYWYRAVTGVSVSWTPRLTVEISREEESGERELAPAA